MNLLIFIMFIELFSAIIAMPEGQMRIQEKTSSDVPIQAGGDLPLHRAQVGGDYIQVGGEVDCGRHQAESCEDCPLVYTHPENPHQFRHDYGHKWCDGDCLWRDGSCELKTSGA